MKRPLPVATCPHCGGEFIKHDRVKARKYCSRECSNSGRSRSRSAPKSVPVPDNDARDADYPGTEWGPLPPALLVRVAARVLAAEYAAWARQRKAVS